MPYHCSLFRLLKKKRRPKSCGLCGWLRRLFVGTKVVRRSDGSYSTCTDGWMDLQPSCGCSHRFVLFSARPNSRPTDRTTSTSRSSRSENRSEPLPPSTIHHGANAKRKPKHPLSHSDDTVRVQGPRWKPHIAHQHSALEQPSELLV